MDLKVKNAEKSDLGASSGAEGLKDNFSIIIWGMFLKYITFSSCSLIIFESLPKLYLKNCFFSIKCQNGGDKFHPRSGSTAEKQPLLCNRFSK